MVIGNRKGGVMVMDTWAIPPFLSFEIRFCLSAPLFFFIHTILILGGAVFFLSFFFLASIITIVIIFIKSSFQRDTNWPCLFIAKGVETGSYKVGTKQADERAFSGLIRSLTRPIALDSFHFYFPGFLSCVNYTFSSWRHRG